MPLSNSHKVYIYCRDDIDKQVNKLLNLYDDIDILYDNGVILFTLIKKINFDLLSNVVNYYMKAINSIPQNRTLEENIHVNRLKAAIEDIEEQIDIPEELEDILRPYSSYSNSSESDEEDLQVFDLEEITKYASAYEPGENNGLTKDMLDALGQDSNIAEV